MHRMSRNVSRFQEGKKTISMHYVCIWKGYPKTILYATSNDCQCSSGTNIVWHMSAFTALYSRRKGSRNPQLHFPALSMVIPLTRSSDSFSSPRRRRRICTLLKHTLRDIGGAKTRKLAHCTVKIVRCRIEERTGFVYRRTGSVGLLRFQSRNAFVQQLPPQPAGWINLGNHQWPVHIPPLGQASKGRARACQK